MSVSTPQTDFHATRTLSRRALTLSRRALMHLASRLQAQYVIASIHVRYIAVHRIINMSE